MKEHYIQKVKWIKTNLLSSESKTFFLYNQKYI